MLTQQESGWQASQAPSALKIGLVAICQDDKLLQMPPQLSTFAAEGMVGPHCRGKPVAPHPPSYTSWILMEGAPCSADVLRFESLAILPSGQARTLNERYAFRAPKSAWHAYYWAGRNHSSQVEERPSDRNKDMLTRMTSTKPNTYCQVRLRPKKYPRPQLRSDSGLNDNSNVLPT